MERDSLTAGPEDVSAKFGVVVTVVAAFVDERDASVAGDSVVFEVDAAGAGVDAAGAGVDAAGAGVDATGEGAGEGVGEGVFALVVVAVVCFVIVETVGCDRLL